MLERGDKGMEECIRGRMQEKKNGGQDRCRMFFVRFFGPRKINILFRFYYYKNVSLAKFFFPSELTQFSLFLFRFVI